jgi:hypothetical protein
MWNSFDDDGYKPIEYRVEGVESIKNDWENIQARIENQLNGFIEVWWGYENKEVYIRPLNWLLGGAEGWIRENDHVTMTKKGAKFLKEGLLRYQKKGRSNLKYDLGKGVRSDAETKSLKLEEITPIELGEHLSQDNHKGGFALHKKVIDEAFAALAYYIGSVEQIKRREGLRFMEEMGFRREDYEFVTTGKYVFPLIKNWSSISSSI